MVAQAPEGVSTALRAEFRELLDSRPDLTATSLSLHTTFAESTIRNWLNGISLGSRDLCEQMGRVLRQVKAGEILAIGGGSVAVITEDADARVRRVAKTGAFYETQTSRRISEVLEYCAEQCEIGVVVAGFGVGKTAAVRHWRARNATPTVVFEFDQFSSTNLVDFIRVLAQQFGAASRVGNQRAGVVFRELCDYLRKNPCLLVLDQCEKLAPRVFQVIRQIWDRTADAGVGIVMLGAPILLERLVGARMSDLEALTSRVGIWARLDGITRSEMASVLKQEGFGEVDSDGFDYWFKACGGSMRRLERSMKLLKAKHAGKRIGEKTIAGVAGHLWGMNVEAA